MTRSNLLPASLLLVLLCGCPRPADNAQAAAKPAAASSTANSAPAPVAPAPSTPATEPATTAQPYTPAPSAAQSRIVDEAIPHMVRSVLPSASATAYLQVQAQLQNLNPERTKSLVDEGLQRLHALTPEDCARYGLTREQYDLWRGQFGR